MRLQSKIGSAISKKCQGICFQEKRSLGKLLFSVALSVCMSGVGLGGVAAVLKGWVVNNYNVFNTFGTESKDQYVTLKKSKMYLAAEITIYDIKYSSEIL